jgi:hypothetical protein
MNRIGTLVFSVLLLVPALPASPAVSAAGVDHFEAGEIRAGLMWDTVSAADSGVLRFGGSAGIHVLDGLELGYEQHFVVPHGDDSQVHTYGYLRAVPFRDWPVHPFVALRAGWFYAHERQAPAAGLGCGAVMFIDRHFAFEARLFGQAIFLPGHTTERRTSLDWRLVLYF